MGFLKLDVVHERGKPGAIWRPTLGFPATTLEGCESQTSTLSQAGPQRVKIFRLSLTDKLSMIACKLAAQCDRFEPVPDDVVVLGAENSAKIRH